MTARRQYLRPKGPPEEIERLIQCVPTRFLRLVRPEQGEELVTSMEACWPREREEDEEAEPLWLDKHRVQGLATLVEQIRTTKHAKLNDHNSPGKSA